MDARELEAIVTRKDLIAAEGARDHAGLHSVALSSLYWRTQDWVEKSLVVHIVQDQRGPHLRSMFSDFLRAPEPEPSFRDHFELTKAVCLAQIKGKPELFDRYYKDRAALRQDVLAETGGPRPQDPQGAQGAPALLGTPTPIAAPNAIPMAKAEPQTQLQNKGALIAALSGMGCLLLFLFAGTLYFVLRPTPASPGPVAASDPGGMPVTAPTPTPAPAPLAPQPGVAPATAPLPSPGAANVVGLSASLGQVTQGTNSTGAIFWLADYVNDGGLPITRPAVIVSLFDESGARVGEQVGHARVSTLAPGARTTVLVLITSPPAYARADVQVRAPTSSRFATAVAEANVVEHRTEPSFGNRVQVVGTVQNDTTTPLRFVSVVVVGRNAAGAPVSFGYAFASTHDLAPGQSSGFQVRLGTFETETPATYDVSASGRP